MNHVQYVCTVYMVHSVVKEICMKSKIGAKTCNGNKYFPLCYTTCTCIDFNLLIQSGNTILGA